MQNKTYQVWVNIEELDHDTGETKTLEISNIGPEFTFLDQAMALKNSLVSLVSTITEQLTRENK